MTDELLIVVTGVSRGLGKALVEGFVSRGHTVCGCARSSDAMERLQQQFGDPHSFEAVDVTNDGVVAAWAGRVLDLHGAPNLLINNAGVVNRNARLWEVPVEEFSQVVDVNVKGPANVIRHFVPAMVSRGSGVIANVSSTWGHSVSAEVAPYCGTKWAIEGLTKALAEELPQGMAAVPMNPGVIHTAMLESCFGGNASAYPEPSEWARRAVPLLLGLGPEHNGQSITVS